MSRTRKNTRSRHLQNKRMDDATYQQRRKVLAWVYRAKDLLQTCLERDLPRIDVRITERHHNILGVARMGDCVVWVPESTVEASKEVLAGTVLHEVLHAVLGQPHVPGCPLMGPTLSKASLATLERLFVDYCRAQEDKLPRPRRYRAGVL